MPPPAPSYEVRVIGHRNTWFGDVYHASLRLPWSQTLLLIVGSFLGLNFIFALLYAYLGGVSNVGHGDILGAFFFSIQTMGTIGYGVMYPTSLLANTLVVLESVCGLLITAIATGLVCAKFSLPTGRIGFSRYATISPVDGVPTLQLRVGNERRNSIAEATVRVDLMRTVVTAEGVKFYRMTELTRNRHRTPALQRSWTLMHPIVPESPLYGATPETFKREEVEIVLSLVGTDDVSFQPVHGRHRYEHFDVIWGARHADVLSETPDGNLVLDVGKFHLLASTEPTADFPYRHAAVDRVGNT